MKITIKNIIDNAGHIPAPLVRAVIRQSGGLASFLEKAPDITRHGINGGYNGWIYYSETEPFAKRHRADILKMAEAQADEFGTTISEMVQGFGVFRNTTDKPTESEIWRAFATGKDDSGHNLLNLMAWYACEEVARVASDLLEE